MNVLLAVDSLFSVSEELDALLILLAEDLCLAALYEDLERFLE